MLELHNVRIKPLNVRKKKKGKPPNMTKELSNVMLELLHIKMKPSNVRKKKGTIECDKKIVKCNVETTQYDDGTVI